MSRLTARVCERPSRVDGDDLKLLGLDLENGSTCYRQGGDGKRGERENDNVSKNKLSKFNLLSLYNVPGIMAYGLHRLHSLMLARAL